MMSEPSMDSSSSALPVSKDIEKNLGIPPDFDAPWHSSDQILISSDGIELHVGKMFLATFSSYFRALFFGKFAKAAKEHVEVDASAVVIRHSLRVLLQLTTGDEPLETLFGMLVFGDQFDVPVIRQYCQKEIMSYVRKDSKNARAAFKMTNTPNTRFLRVPLLSKMNFESVMAVFKEFFENNAEIILNTEECIALIKAASRCWTVTSYTSD